MKEGLMTGTPLVLVVNCEEWSTRSIESILKPNGYAVLMAYTGRQGLQLASKIRPDLILIDFNLSDLTGIDLCDRMRQLPTVRASTPIVLSTSGPVTRNDRLAAFEAGAWEILSPPLYPKEMLARFGAFIGAKREADAAHEHASVDPLTGFYNAQGLMRRVAEMSADTDRSKRSLACVVLGQSSAGVAADVPTTLPDDFLDLESQPPGTDPSHTLANLIGSVTRLGDVVGKVGEDDFVIVAPGTDMDGAVRLAERIMNAVDQGRSLHQELGGLKLTAGYYALPAAEHGTVQPEEFLRRATSALREAQGIRSNGNDNGAALHSFGMN